MRTARRTAFTLLELLVVVAIIGTLSALLLPAVQSARESSRRTHCNNNIAQVAKAMLMHESQHRTLPSGGWGSAWLGVAGRQGGPAQPGGWAYSILPYIEEQATHDAVLNAAGNWEAAYQRLAATSVQAFNCSSRSGRRVLAGASRTYRAAGDTAVSITTAARCDYAANSGSAGSCGTVRQLARVTVNGAPGNVRINVCHVPNGNGQHTTVPVALGNPAGHLAHENDYIGTCGSCDDAVDELLDDHAIAPLTLAKGDDLRTYDTVARVFRNDSGDADVNTAMLIVNQQDGIGHFMSRVTAAHVFDGLSNVYLVGEKYVAADAYETGTDPGDNRAMYAGYSSSTHRWGREAPRPDTRGEQHPTVFGSAHAGVWNVAFGDGSVRSLTYDISPELHKRLASRNDGQVAVPP